MKRSRKKTFFISLFTFIWGFLVVYHGILSSVTAGNLEWRMYHVLPHTLTVEAIHLDNQLICCSICVGGRATELGITNSPRALNIDTSSSLVSFGNQHITLENVKIDEIDAPMVTFLTLKEGTEGNISFVSIFRQYQRILSY